MDPQAPRPTRAGIKVLHLVLLAGLILVSAVFALLFKLGTAPLLRGEGLGPIGTVLGAVSFVTIAYAYVFVRPKMPPRPPGVSEEVFWRDNGVGPFFLAWIIWEGGAIIGAVGTLLTGSWLTAIGAGLGIVVLATHGPGYFERPQPSAGTTARR